MYWIYRSPDEYLASLFRVDVATLHEHLGLGWRVVDPGTTSPSGSWIPTWGERNWFVAGTPDQVMLGLGASDVCVTAPEIALNQRPYTTPSEPIGIYDLHTLEDLSALRPAVEAAERQRRSLFSYCRFCRRIYGPELMLNTDVCVGCGSDQPPAGYPPRHDLADLFGTSPETFREFLGHGWRRAEQSHSPASDRAWFYAGEPVQVMIGWGMDDAAVAVPRIEWSGHTPVTSASEIIETRTHGALMGGSALRPAAEEAQRRRRAEFIYCRFCRRLTDPGHMLSFDQCQGCGSAIQGIVF